MNVNYPYLHQYDEHLKTFQLVQTSCKPVGITSNSRVAGSLETVILSGRSGNSEIILDFGRELVGYAEIKLTADKDAQIQLYYGEDLSEASREEPYQSSWYLRPSDSFNLPAGEHQIRSRGRRAWRFLRIRLHSEQASVRLEDVTGILQHYPVVDRGSFTCSEERLNQIWQISAYTTRLCMQQFFEDGIKRDGLLWIGDYRMEFLSAWYCFGDMELARKCLFMFAATQRVDGAIPACAGLSGGHQHPECIDYMPGIPHGFVETWMILNYMTDYISCLSEYEMLTGDYETVKELWPAVVRCMSFLQKRVNLQIPGLGVSMDSEDPADIITDAFPGEGSWSRSDGTFLLQLYKAVSDTIQMAKRFEDTEYPVQLSEYRVTLKSLMENNYYSPENQWFTNFPGQPATGWHVNMFGILSGFVGKEEGHHLLKRMINQNLNNPNAGFMTCWKNTALFEVGLTVNAMNDIRRDWGKMIDAGATTCWERMDALEFNLHNPSEAPASYCHGWTAGPAYQLPRYVLGVSPVEAGFKKVRIQPRLGDLKWAEGSIPTPMGEIYIRMESGASPPGVVKLPDGIEAIFIDSKGTEHALNPGTNMIMKYE